MTNIASSAVRFQADAETVRQHLDEIQAEWTQQGIETPVLDAYGDIDPDAEAELLERLPVADHDYVLMDAETAEPIGPASVEQVKASLRAGDTGIILIDADGDVVAEQDANQPYTPQPVRRVYAEA